MDYETGLETSRGRVTGASPLSFLERGVERGVVRELI